MARGMASDAAVEPVAAGNNAGTAAIGSRGTLGAGNAVAELHPRRSGTVSAAMACQGADTQDTVADGDSTCNGEVSPATAYQDNLTFTASLTTVFPKAANYRDAIRRKCLDCCCGDRSEVRRCHLTNCALWPFRMGRNPFRAERRTQTGFDGC